MSRLGIGSLCFLLAAFNSLHAGSLQSGIGAAGEKTDALRAYGGYLFFLILVLVVFLLVFRGREIRRQHPRVFH